MDHPDPVNVGTFETRWKHDGPRVTTVTRMEALRRQKATTVMRMASPTLTGHAFEAFQDGAHSTGP